ncbi:MAG: hypoxanthine phosphoribosyltransferase [Armatimonadetes bacterium CG07_land_8_20_14_0_80_40_9]|nr:MAG: hypoxanthine phosphoribosyltransferase [Armatimonadetes bacterium CG07_land_8_20_14_0_80_40_9]
MQNNEIGEVLITEKEIRKKVKELGKKISRDYEGKDLVLVCVLRGAVIFMSDLIRSISIPLSFDFMAISSYGSDTKSSGVVKITKDLDESIESKHVLIVEDIVDTGLTLQYLTNNLSSRNVASLKICALLDKPAQRKVEVKIDYKGFTIPDKFVVGYGLDYNQKYRYLPYISALKHE